MANYPTKKQILASLYVPRGAEFDAIRQWKKLHYNKKWSKHTDETKIELLKTLIRDICEARGINRLKWPTLMSSEHPWTYNPSIRLITMCASNPSIVSTLHELGHYLHFNKFLTGKIEEAEHVACRYSVGIFKTCFPHSYKKLTWDTHVLVAAKEGSNKK